MDFTKLPTDNFYIFLSFAGIGIIYLAYLIFAKRISQIKESISSFNKSIIERKNHVFYLRKEIAYITKKILFLECDFKLKYKLAFNRSQAEDVKEFTFPNEILLNKLTDNYIVDFLRIDRLYLYLDKQINEAQLGVDLLDYESSLIEKNLSRTESLKNYFNVSVCSGLIILLFGLNSWYFLHQTYQDNLLKLNYETELIKYKEDTMNSKIPPSVRLYIDSLKK